MVTGLGSVVVFAEPRKEYGLLRPASRRTDRFKPRPKPFRSQRSACP